MIKVSVLTLFFLALLLIFDPSRLGEEGVQANVPHLRQLAVLHSEPDLLSADFTPQDFNGDSVRDIVGQELSQQESGSMEGAHHTTLTVQSGSSGERLFAVSADRGSRFLWYGDYDNNGTTDIVLNDGERWLVFGLVID